MTTSDKKNLRQIRKSFRGWAVPGPLPDKEAMHRVLCDEGETLDALSGHFRIFQLRDGHRFSTDDVLTAWYGSSWCPSAGRVLDLGSGIGSVAMIAAWRLRGAQFVTVEAQDKSVGLARKSMAYNGLGNRFEIRHGDFRDANILGPDETFDLVLGSPPYFPVPAGTVADHDQKAACRFEMRGDISDYAKTAAAHLGPGGHFCCVFPIDPNPQHERVLAAAKEHDLVILRWRPVIFSEGRKPTLGLFAMVRKQDLPPAMHDRAWVEPPLIIRRGDGSVHPEYQTVKMSVGFPP